MLSLSEVFVSHQGEGPRSGRLCTFIRLGGCNLSCSWCDTPYTWDAKRFDLRQELKRVKAEDIMALVPGDVDEVVITGGEPLMHQKTADWEMLLRLLNRADKYICVETNGTIAPTPVTQTYVRHYSISPKLPNAGTHKKGQSPVMAVWPNRLRHDGTCLKFVVKDESEVRVAAELADSLGWQRRNVWMMPEGRFKEFLLDRWPEICDEAKAQRVNVTMRLHVLAYGDTRGT